MAYFAELKLLHLACAGLSLALFLLRGGWMLMESPRLQDRWVRVVPHVVDTAFLASGIGLVVMLRQYPFVHGWLTAKVFGLIAYVILGSVALKRGRTRGIRAGALVLAVAVFIYILGVARMKNPASWAAWISH